jgi:hypothetical protein
VNNNQTKNDCSPTKDAGLHEPSHGAGNALPTMIAEIRELMSVLTCLDLQDYAEKARRLRLVLVHETLRLAALTALSATDALLKAAFLRDQLTATSLSLSPLAQTIIEAALAFEAELFRDQPTHH